MSEVILCEIGWPTVQFRTCDFFVNNWYFKKKLKVTVRDYPTQNPHLFINSSIQLWNTFPFFVCIWFVLQAKWQHSCVEAAISWLVYFASSYVDLKVYLYEVALVVLSMGRNVDNSVTFVWYSYGNCVVYRILGKLILLKALNVFSFNASQSKVT